MSIVLLSKTKNYLGGAENGKKEGKHEKLCFKVPK